MRDLMEKIEALSAADWERITGQPAEELVAQGYLDPAAVSPDLAAPTRREARAARAEAKEDDAALIAAMYGPKDDPKDAKIAQDVERAKHDTARAKAAAERELIALAVDRIGLEMEQIKVERERLRLARERKEAEALGVEESIDVPAGLVPPIDALSIRGLPVGVGRR